MFIKLKNFSKFGNESGSVQISSAFISLFVVILLVSFGETVTTCYQWLSLQHAAYEGLRTSVVTEDDSSTLTNETGNEADSNVRRIASETFSGDGDTSKKTMVYGSALISGVSVSAQDPHTDDHWLAIDTSKTLFLNRLASFLTIATGNGTDSHKTYQIKVKARGSIESY